MWRLRQSTATNLGMLKQHAPVNTIDRKGVDKRAISSKIALKLHDVCFARRNEEWAIEALSRRIAQHKRMLNTTLIIRPSPSKSKGAGTEKVVQLYEAVWITAISQTTCGNLNFEIVEPTRRQTLSKYKEKNTKQKKNTKISETIIKGSYGIANRTATGNMTWD